MLKVISLTAIAALTLAVTATSQPAFAGGNGGAIAAGVVGGLAVGAIVGSQMNHNDGYRHHAYYRDCRIERRDFEDRYGRLHVRRVRVCN